MYANNPFFTAKVEGSFGNWPKAPVFSEVAFTKAVKIFTFLLVSTFRVDPGIRNIAGTTSLKPGDWIGAFDKR
jgi:hypothetical protein